MGKPKPRKLTEEQLENLRKGRALRWKGHKKKGNRAKTTKKKR